jgi:hypothetical protein
LKDVSELIGNLCANYGHVGKDVGLLILFLSFSFIDNALCANFPGLDVYLEKENRGSQSFTLLILLVIKVSELLYPVSRHLLLKKGKLKQLDILHKFELFN